MKYTAEEVRENFKKAIKEDIINKIAKSINDNILHDYVALKFPRDIYHIYVSDMLDDFLDKGFNTETEFITSNDTVLVILSWREGKDF